MSALRDLVYGKGNRPWPYFSEKFPVKTEIAGSSSLRESLEANIREAGDHLQKRTSAKCLMTRWNMHEEYASFETIGNYAITLAHSCPVAQRTTPDGKKENVPLHVKESWGLIYVKGNTAETHNHWPSLWSYTYCVKAGKCCAPLRFPTAMQELEIIPEAGQLILFPAWIMHEVHEHICDHERIMISGNLDANWK